MPDPLRKRVVRLIERLARRGLTQRAIAREAGVALGTVNAVLRGTYRTPKPDPRLNPGEWLLDPPRLCADNNHRINIAPCRKCGALPKAEEPTLPVTSLKCERCASSQAVRVSGNQVRCARCGSFLCRKSELAARVAREGKG